MVAANRLLGRGNQVLFSRSFRVVSLPCYLIELLVVIFKLRDTRHKLLFHEVGRLEHVISLFIIVRSFLQESNRVVDDGLVKQDSSVREEISSVSRNIAAAVRVIPTNAPEEVIVRQRLRWREDILDRVQWARKLEAFRHRV